MNESLSQDERIAATVVGTGKILTSVHHFLKEAENLLAENEWGFKPFRLGKRSSQLMPSEIKTLSDTEPFPHLFACFFSKEVSLGAFDTGRNSVVKNQSFTQVFYLAVDFSPSVDNRDQAVAAAVVAAGIWIYSSDQMKGKSDWQQGAWQKMASLHRSRYAQTDSRLGGVMLHDPIAWPEDVRSGDTYGAVSMCIGLSQITSMERLRHKLVEPLLKSDELRIAMVSAFSRVDQIHQFCTSLENDLRGKLGKDSGKEWEKSIDPIKSACAHDGFGVTFYPWGKGRLAFRVETESTEQEWRIAGGLYSEKAIRGKKDEVRKLRTVYGDDPRCTIGDEGDFNWIGWMYFDVGKQRNIFSLLDWISAPENIADLITRIVEEVKRVEKRAKQFNIQTKTLKGEAK